MSEYNLTQEQIEELAEIFLVLEKWQYELDFKQQEENQHSGSVERTHVKHVPSFIAKPHRHEENVVSTQELE